MRMEYRGAKGLNPTVDSLDFQLFPFCSSPSPLLDGLALLLACWQDHGLVRTIHFKFNGHLALGDVAGTLCKADMHTTRPNCECKQTLSTRFPTLVTDRTGMHRRQSLGSGLLLLACNYGLAYAYSTCPCPGHATS